MIFRCYSFIATVGVLEALAAKETMVDGVICLQLLVPSSGVLVSVYQLALRVERSLICSIFQLLWYKYFHHGRFQNTDDLTTSWPNS